MWFFSPMTGLLGVTATSFEIAAISRFAVALDALSSRLIMAVVRTWPLAYSWPRMNPRTSWLPLEARLATVAPLSHRSH
tara:strand:+ start:543 stop:779 length:237 start_codon:yes stop_codon:yes gene_type:complete